jgi:hypothetical protein
MNPAAAAGSDERESSPVRDDGSPPTSREVGVPTVHRFGPYRFFFWSHENQATGEPPQIHVESGDGLAGFWLSPVRLRKSWGYTHRELRVIRRLVEAHQPELLRRWHEFFVR